jgi:hypothetical protein
MGMSPILRNQLSADVDLIAGPKFTTSIIKQQKTGAGASQLTINICYAMACSDAEPERMRA